MAREHTAVRQAGAMATGAIFLVALYLTSLHSYLLFHSLIELFTVTVAVGVFGFAWNARRYLDNNYLLFVGIASLFVGILDLVHALAYQGIGIFGQETSNLATQLWTISRYLQSLAMFSAPFFLGRRLRPYLTLVVLAIITGLLFATVFVWHVFPAAYVVGTGLTPFKKISEYVVSVVYLGAIGLLWWKRQAFEPRVLHLLIASLALTIASEISFASYVSVYGEANMIGHFFRLGAVYALDAYAHTVAHDLKTPLSVIIGTADVMSSTSVPSEKRTDLLGRIESTAFEMNGIVDNLLLLSEVRKADVPTGPVDMDTVVHNVRNRLQDMIQQHDAEVVAPDTWPAAIGYAPWIEEVWANYLSNALKYGGHPPRVELGASVQPDHVCFWVRDNGEGVPPSARSRLFVPFSQLSRGASHGLGLSIVLQIVEKLGGEVGMENDEGGGSIFYFTLPTG
ncbi:MAG: MASE3 domain-containing protein [Gemmatimonadota bacterium]